MHQPDQATLLHVGCSAAPTWFSNTIGLMESQLRSQLNGASAEFESDADYVIE